MDHLVYKGAYGMELELAHTSDEEALNKLGLFSQKNNEEIHGNSLQIHKLVRIWEGSQLISLSTAVMENSNELKSQENQLSYTLGKTC